LIELLVVIAIIALLISILLPSLSRARELSKRLVCQSSIKGIGTSAKIYANDNGESWMIPPFDRSKKYSEGERISYTSESITSDTGIGAVGFKREERSYSFDSEASEELSVTRAYWMLVRAGDVTPKQFVCPSATAEEDPTEDIDFYYDFTSVDNISYGYQVPFGPRDTRPREGVDNRQVLAADRGPFYTNPGTLTWDNPATGETMKVNDSPKEWRQFNSPNHGGSGNGEGQNALFADGHANFERVPCVGIDNDNIYTVIKNEWNDADGLNRVQGEAPTSIQPDPFPGDDAFPGGEYSSTDTLVYP